MSTNNNNNNHPAAEDDEEIAGMSSPRRPSQSLTRCSVDPLLFTCWCFGAITALSAVLCIFVNVLTAVRSFKHRSDIFDVIFRAYAVLVALFVIAAETEWGFVFKFWRMLEYWAGRGMLQIFAAVMTKAFADANEKRKDILLLQDIASYLLLCCGLIYVISGVLCIGFLKRARQKKQVSRGQAVKDLEELERRREELEALLIQERARDN